MTPLALLINIYIFLKYLKQRITSPSTSSSSSKQYIVKQSKLVTFWIYYGFIMCILAPLISILDDIQPICQYTHRLSLTVPLKSCHTFSQISLLQHCFSGNNVGYSPSIIYMLYALGFIFQICQWSLIQYGSNIGKSPYMCYAKLDPISIS